MSGGVDSSVSALLLTRSGIRCIGATMTLGTNDDEANVAGARAVCAMLGIPHVTFELSDTFREEVITPFIGEHEAGLTPNPCVTCNTRIKFGAFARMAAELGCDTIATGHYLRKRTMPDGIQILRAIDERKDQSYFLSRVPIGVLEHASFPLGALTKAEVKKLAQKAELPSVFRKESQDICFIQGSCTEFLKEHLGARPGHIVDPTGKHLGDHEGAYLYTIGQRKGLGVALGHPAYVCAKDATRNEVMIGPLERAQVSCVAIQNMNWLAHAPSHPFACSVKLRYNMEPVSCLATCEDDQLLVELSAPTLAPAPGQTAALYNGSMLLGGGKII